MNISNELKEHLHNNKRNYFQIPESLEKELDSSYLSKDSFGVKERWQIIQESFPSGSLGRIVELGGNNGFFCLSALDKKLGSDAIVYDLNKEAIRLGEIMAKEMDLDKIKFLEQEVNMDFVKSMDGADTIFSFNLMHWAGTSFDNELVRELGWDNYMEAFFKELRGKFSKMVFSTGLQKYKPNHWNIANGKRAYEIEKIMERSGWKVNYSANVGDINVFGPSKANGMRKSFLNSLLLNNCYKVKRGLSKLMGSQSRGRKEAYHLYICE